MYPEMYPWRDLRMSEGFLELYAKICEYINVYFLGKSVHYFRSESQIMALTLYNVWFAEISSKSS